MPEGVGILVVSGWKSRLNARTFSRRGVCMHHNLAVDLISCRSEILGTIFIHFSDVESPPKFHSCFFFTTPLKPLFSKAGGWLQAVGNGIYQQKSEFVSWFACGGASFGPLQCENQSTEPGTQPKNPLLSAVTAPLGQSEDRVIGAVRHARQKIPEGVTGYIQRRLKGRQITRKVLLPYVMVPKTSIRSRR